MAKSIRSARKRMLRRIKRVKYEAKELQRLKDMLARAEEKNSGTSNTLNQEIVTVVRAKDIKCGKEVDSKNLNVDKATSDSTEGCSTLPSVSSAITVSECGTEMDQCPKVDGGNINSLGNVEGERGVPLIAKVNRSLGDETEMGHSEKPGRESIKNIHGKFPVWMNQRQIQMITGKLAIKKQLREQNAGKRRRHRRKLSKRALKRKNQRMEAKMSRKS